MCRLINQTRSAVVAEQVTLADGFWSRFKGLMLRKQLADGEGLLLTGTSSVHTALMRFPIDVVFLDKQHAVVKVVPALKPYRVAFSRGSSTLELPAGQAGEIERGDVLVMERPATDQ